MKKSFNSYLLKAKKLLKIQKKFFKIIIKNTFHHCKQLSQKFQLIHQKKCKKQAKTFQQRKCILEDYINNEAVSFELRKELYQLSEMEHIIKSFEQIFTKIQLEKTKCSQLSVLMYLIWTNNKKLIKIYIKYREQILQKCTFDKTKNNPVCLHNQAKYLKEAVFIGQIQVQFQVCQFMIQYFHSQIPIQMIQWLGQGKKSVDSLQLLHVFLWQTQNKELVHRLSSQMEHQNN